MKHAQHHTGFAIAIAWPETLCKQPNSWYDIPLRWLGINKNWFYKAGHAALVLIEDNEKKCHYFDFGRYHSPFNFGRVRSAVTDHDLAVRTIPRISNDGNSIENFREILEELQQNSSCHGDGTLFASYCRIDFKLSWAKVLELQNASPLPYGPFVKNGSNCSRFVNTAILAGKPFWDQAFQLKHFVPFTPTTLNNVNSLKHKTVIQAIVKTGPIDFSKKLTEYQLKMTLSAPVRNPSIPEDVQWLSGEGAGSWFHIEYKHPHYVISRFSPNGTIECRGLFKVINDINFMIESDYSFTHLSHCDRVSIMQNGRVLNFLRMNSDPNVCLTQGSIRTLTNALN